MEPNNPTHAIRAAASILMLRDGEAGLEVFLLRRHGRSAILGGAYVFPGGKVDEDDSEPALLARLDLPAEVLHANLNEPELGVRDAAAIHMAALREVFEEAGVLYAGAADSVHTAAAARLLSEGCSFAQVLATLALRLEASRLHPWSRWITPAENQLGRRFDTRFFVARVPAGQEPRHDQHEATESVWLTPRAALTRYWDRAIELVPPQIMSLVQLARHDSVASVLAQARERQPPLIEPHPFEQEGMRVVCYPGDARHSLRERALVGPTRLQLRSRRYEPPGGFEAFFEDRADMPGRH